MYCSMMWPRFAPSHVHVHSQWHFGGSAHRLPLTVMGFHRVPGSLCHIGTSNGKPKLDRRGKPVKPLTAWMIPLHCRRYCSTPVSMPVDSTIEVCVSHLQQPRSAAGSSCDSLVAYTEGPKMKMVVSVGNDWVVYSHFCRPYIHSACRLLQL